jgi:Chromo (CHRromatin Organisation MOdifier) domain
MARTPDLTCLLLVHVITRVISPLVVEVQIGDVRKRVSVQHVVQYRSMEDVVDTDEKEVRADVISSNSSASASTSASTPASISPAADAPTPALSPSSTPSSSSSLSSSEEEYLVERILEHRSLDNKYLVKWTSYPLCQATWEPMNDLPVECIHSFWTSRFSNVAMVMAYLN